jgi:hypothetical protein
MSTAQDDALVVALARATVERAAPEELVLFPAASEAYLQGQDPSKATRGDPMLGFGVDAAVVLVAPVALTVAKDVLAFLRVQLKKHAEERGDDAVDWLINRLFGGKDDESPATAPADAAAPAPAPADADADAAVAPADDIELTDEELEQVRALALEKAKQLKLPDAKAQLLADSLVGSLATA